MRQSRRQALAPRRGRQAQPAARRERFAWCVCFVRVRCVRQRVCVRRIVFAGEPRFCSASRQHSKTSVRAGRACLLPQTRGALLRASGEAPAACVRSCGTAWCCVARGLALRTSENAWRGCKEAADRAVRSCGPPRAARPAWRRCTRLVRGRAAPMVQTVTPPLTRVAQPHVVF
jgi:hypothetical protein